MKGLVQRYDKLSESEQKKRGLKLYGTMFNWKGDKVYTYKYDWPGPDACEA